MGKFKDLTGERFTRILVVSRAENNKHNHTCWNCICDCGNEIIVTSGALRAGQESCGCLRKEQLVTRLTRHGMHKTKFYHVWEALIQRVTNPNDFAYKNYGERGITIDPCWLDFIGFKNDMFDGYKEGLTIDRIDVNKGYSKENCRWVGYDVQGHNKRKREGCSSQYLGVCACGRDKMWKAEIRKDFARMNLGRFQLEEDAARAYDNASEHLYGDRPNGTER